MCGRLVNLDTVARVLADYYHLKTDAQLAALDEALSRVPAVSVGGGYRKDHVVDPGNMVGDSISRAAAIEAIKEDKIDLTDPNVVAVFKATGDFEKAETQSMTCDRHIKILKDLPSAQLNLSEAYSKAVFTWLMDYQIRAAELKGRYTPYEVLSWVANDWRKEHERFD